jgi:ABC-type transport system substrate-binding protein
MFRHIPLLEKILVFLLLIVISVFSWQLFSKFRDEHSYAAPAEGGVYTEGLSGRLTTLNPLLARSSVDRDIAHLIFAGLTRYNPVTGKIEGDLATYSLSSDRKTYTFRLKDNIYWHDGEPVTTDDVIYTYKVVLQNPYFKNSFLRSAFKDVEIERISSREVLFTLKKPYAFFLSNVTVGLLPKHILNLVPIENIEKSDFSQHPVGCGPFEFVSLEHRPYESRVVLKRYENYHSSGPLIDSVVFRIFPTSEDLISNVNSLTAVKNYNGPGNGEVLDERFHIVKYTLPQYVAAFLNTQSPIFSVGKTRFGFLLATDKEALLAELGGEKEVVDTPLLEAKQGLDIEYNELRAKGAFFDTDWKLINKIDDTPKKPAFEVEISATLDTWLELSIDGEKQDGVLMQPDDKKRFTFQDSFIFVNVGNAGGISFSVNGVEGKKLGLEGEVLKDFVVSKDSLDELLTNELAVGESEESEETEGDDSTEDLESVDEYVAPEDAMDVFMSNIEPSELRHNKEGEPLRVRLITASVPAEFVEVAKVLQKQWVRAGVDAIVEVYDPDLLQDKIRERDYDVLLFGQNLGYNLDAFPFWHSSQAENGLNLSQYKSFESDTLLTEIRSIFDVNVKAEKLNQLKKQIIKDTPAVFLYRPVYQYAVDKKVQGLDLSHLAIDSDRFNSIQSWFVREKKVFQDGISFSDFMSWLRSNL